jgi:hypothetical protein
VGRSTNCPERILEHCGLGGRGIAQLGRLIEDSEDGSFSWTVRFFTPEEFGVPDIGEAEVIAIERLRPCLNRTFVTSASRLPERYTTKERERGEKLRLKMQRRGRGA